VNLSELWAEISQSNWWQQLMEMRAGANVAVVGAIGALLLLLIWFGGWQQKRTRTRAMLAAVSDATFGRCIPRSRSGAWGFAVGVEPPPDRFGEFNISYQPLSIFDPIDLLRFWFGGRRTTFRIAGVLNDAPTAEITWVRGQPPARSLGMNPGRAPWVQGRLDFAGAEYATRGANVGAIKHVFQDMYARFTPALLSISVQRERRPQLRVVVEGRIDARDISPLITSARALGRAAILD
jgi:hypothetical protein